MALVLEHLVSSGPVHQTSDQLQQGTSQHTAITPGPISVQMHTKWWSRFFPGSLESTMDRLFASHHMGNYVAIRGQPGQRIFESMPIYVRVGMHLLFYKSKEQSFLRYKSVEDLLKTVSVRQGRVYDDESNPQAVLEHIQSFVQTYSINLDELLQPDPSQYPSFNSFFFRKLKPGARPIAEPENASIVSSCADCRLTVFSDVGESTRYWIKGDGFTLNRLIGDTNLADRCFPPGSSIAIFRLAPADYHRFHYPVGPALCGPTRHIAGEYFTVNVSFLQRVVDVMHARADVSLIDRSDTSFAPISGPNFATPFLVTLFFNSIYPDPVGLRFIDMPGTTFISTRGWDPCISLKRSMPTSTSSQAIAERFLYSIGVRKEMQALPSLWHLSRLARCWWVPLDGLMPARARLCSAATSAATMRTAARPIL